MDSTLAGYRFEDRRQGSTQDYREERRETPWWLYGPVVPPREKGGRGLRAVETEYKVTKVKAALRLHENKDQVMEMVREFEERAESLGHRSLVKDATKFAEDLGVNLHLKHPEPVCAVNSGEIIPSYRVKEVLKECVEEKLEREVRGLE